MRRNSKLDKKAEMDKKVEMNKKMKSRVVMVLSFAVAGVILAGCGESRQDAQQSTPVGTEQESGWDSMREDAESEDKESENAGAGDANSENIDMENMETENTESENTASEVEEKTEQAAEKYEDNYAVDSQAAKEFAGKVKDAVARRDLEALAELTSFPVYVGLPDVGAVKTKEDFLKLGAEAVFTDGLREAIDGADIENMQPSRAGFSISAGGTANINFGVVDGVLAISGINY